MTGIWNRVIELSAPIIGQPTVDALQKNLAVSENISWLHATLPRARLLIERSESWCYIYKPIDDLLPQLKKAVKKAQAVLDEFESQRQTLEGANWSIQGELVNNLKIWICGFPDNVESAKGMLDQVCNEMEKICSMFDIPKTPNQFSEHISKLRATLPRARLLIERSECWCFRNDCIKKLLPQLKEAVYKAEAELDNIESKKSILDEANWRIHSELFYYLTNWISDFPGKVKSAQDTLEHVCNEMEELCKTDKIPENPNQFSNNARPITCSGHREIYGRDKELYDAIRLLTVTRSGSSGTKIEKKESKSGSYSGENSSSTKKKGNLAILPIVGMGGVGKTTLAQMVYNDKRVKSYFDLRIWICVSDKFDLERLTKHLIECATEKECNLTNLNKVQETLEEILKSKRVLLVLDDIWSKEWQDLLGPMNEASDGSAVILTTRSAEHFECTGGNITILDSIMLEGLEKKIYWDFFKSCADLQVGSENYGELVGIAEEICKKLKGSPLAAKTLGGLLRKMIDKQHWINVRDSKMWELKHGENDIVPVLQLSYQYLPSHLKKCFSYCSLYPKDHEFTDIELAKFWIMEGFIPIQENLKHTEDLALGYFHELKNNCFFHSKGSSRKPEIYVIHDLMYDVCQSITTQECYCLEGEDFGKISHNVHHISLFIKKPNREKLRKVHKFKKLLSLLVVSPNCHLGAIQSWCDELVSIRRLSLSNCKMDTIPENIGNLRHLQYLDISDTEIERLPNSFCNLCNLEHLDMSGCINFSESWGFPNGSNMLKGLQFFIPPVHLVPFLAHMPNLLRTMQLYNLSYPVKNDGGYTIENIKHLSSVRGFLDIRELENVSRKEDAEEAELNKQEHLDTLRLYWQINECFTRAPFSESNEIHMEVLEGLRPHSNLTVLEIFNYNGQDLSPSWMGDGLPNLRRVLIRHCLTYTLSQLPRSITELEISWCCRLTSVQNCLQPNLLPKLKCIEIVGCEELESVPVESFCEFVSLEKLRIVECEKLICPSNTVLPPSIKVLHLISCGELDNSIPSCLQNLTSLDNLSIFSPHRVSFPDELMRNNKSLRRLIWCTQGLDISWDQNKDDRQLSALAAAASAAPSSLPTIPSDSFIPSIETPSTALAAPASAAPSDPHIPWIEAPSTGFWNKAIKFLATTIGQSAVDAFGQSSVVSENISRLRATLPRARLLIKRSECWHFKYKQIDELLPQLKEAVYKAEISLDEYEYQKRRLEQANWRIPGELINNFNNWVSGFPVKVKTAEGSLEQVCDELEKICNNFDVPENPNQFGKTARPITSSVHPKIYGRDKALADAIRLLTVSRLGSGVKNKGNKSGLYMGDSSSTIRKKGKIAILPIVGMGGVGKTTLTQMVYNDKRVQSYFDLKAWICVSDQFDLERLTKEIIEYVTKKECDLTNLYLLQETLIKTVKGKRVLLVLDDIWSKDWQRLLGSINEASEGSAIILTTRDPKHVECTMGDMTILDTIRLEGLEENIYWDFFRSCAGLEIASQNYVQLEDIAREICSRLKGSPLAAITLGGLLRKRIDKQQWINIRESKMWQLKQGEHDIMPALQLSYQYLPSHLKKCFSFCSLYPKDHRFTDIELAKFWIMEGFIPIQDNLKNMEDLALGYFHDLKASCFFHSKEIGYSEKYVIHDLMHDVCQNITKDECYCLEDENFGKVSVDVHHISVFQKKPNPENLREMHRFKKLQSLVASPSCGFRAIKSLFTVLTSIRCLSLSKCKINTIPGNIGNLKHLQYLDISQTQIQKLPDSFCTLYNLQHLDMSGCNKILGFPDDSSKLTNLQFFRPPHQLVPSLTRMPNLKGAMQLYDLTYEVRNDGIHKIEDMKHLIGVRGFLYIKGLKNVSRKEAAEEAELNKQEYLDTLHLDWDNIYGDPVICTEVLECLRPHSNLRVLGIFEYNSQDLSPSWMGDGLPNLRSVLFERCSNCTLSQLPRSITELQIKSNYSLTSLQDCLQPNLLPKLKFLEIDGCTELVSLPVESFCEFVSLEKFKIDNCGKLKCPRKMVLPPSIKLLHLRKCGELENSIPSCLENLTSLEDLKLFDCPHIVSIPDEVMRNLKSLRLLYVWQCYNLESLGDEEFLESIKNFKIKLCPKLKITRGRNPDGMKLSGELGAAAPSSSHTIPPEPHMPLIETPTTALGSSASAPSSPHIIPPYPHMPSIEAPSTDAATTPGSAHTIPSNLQMLSPEIVPPGARAAAIPSAAHTIPSFPQMPSVEAPTTDTPSSSNSRKRKATPESN